MSLHYAFWCPRIFSFEPAAKESARSFCTIRILIIINMELVKLLNIVVFCMQSAAYSSDFLHIPRSFHFLVGLPV